VRVAGVVLPRHGREGVAQVTPVTRKTARVMAAGAGVVVQRPVVAVAGYAALLLQLHQGFDLLLVVLMVGL